MFSKFFINRPIFATVLALLIVVAGLVTLGILPIAQYPDITPPTVQVSAVYPGANAQTVAQTVGIPIEQQVNGVEGMLYMSSNSSSSGAYSLTITFAVGTDIDMATVQVQNRVSVAQASLPTPVVVQGVTVQKQSSNIVMFLTMTSENKEYDGLYLSNYATLNLVDQLTRVPGVGAVNVMGAGDYSMRIWLDPAALRIRNLSAADVYQAIQSQNVEVSAGAVGQPLPGNPAPGNTNIGNVSSGNNAPAYQYSLTVKGRLSSPEEFGNIILRTEAGGRVLRLRDVAHIDLGSASYSVVSRLNGHRRHCHLSATGFQFAGCIQRREREDAGTVRIISQRHPLQCNPGYDRRHPRFSGRSAGNFPGNNPACGTCHLPFLTELAGGYHSVYHHSRITHRYSGSDGALRILHQYTDAVRINTCRGHCGG